MRKHLDALVPIAFLLVNTLGLAFIASQLQKDRHTLHLDRVTATGPFRVLLGLMDTGPSLLFLYLRAAPAAKWMSFNSRGFCDRSSRRPPSPWASVRQFGMDQWP